MAASIQRIVEVERPTFVQLLFVIPDRYQEIRPAIESFGIATY